MERPGTISRRTFLGLGAAAAVAACSDGDGSGDTSDLVVLRYFDQRLVEATGTPQRTVWGLGEGGLPLTSGAPESLVATVLDLDGNPLADPVETVRRDDGLVRPYYLLAPTFTAPGSYQVRFESDLGTAEGFLTVEAASPIALPGVGDPFPTVTTPTITSPEGADPICTRTPVCPFHDVTPAEARAAGRPVVLIITTPAFCAQGDICGPVLEILLDAVDDGDPALPDDVAVVHAEVYAAPPLDGNRADGFGPLAPVMTQVTTDGSALGYEPMLLVGDRQGVVTARLDFIWDRSEQRQALATLT